MSCCDQDKVAWNGQDYHRRTFLKGATALAGLVTAVAGAGAVHAAGKTIKLAFCSQLLCIIPYEVARAGGHFAKEGLDVQLVYARGGSAAMQALVGGAVDYAATSLDVAIQAYAHGGDIRRFVSTGKLPLFALATSPKSASLDDLKKLEGHTIGVSALGNADHALALFLLKKAGADATKVKFATLGTNLLEGLRQNQIDAGLVQEPALTEVVKSGGKVLVNAMQSDDAQRYLGGNYEFMGVAVRTAERDARLQEMQALARALQSALGAVQTLSPDDLVKSLPREMTTGADVGEMRDLLEKYRASLYPTTAKIDLAAADRVADSLKIGGLLADNADTHGLYDTSIIGG